jgi:hypothetical protein
VGEQLGELAVVQHRPHLLARGDVGELRPGETGVHHDQAGPELAGGEHGQHQATVVAGQHGDNVTTLQAVGLQRPCQRVGLLVELPERDGALLVDQRHRVRVLAGNVLGGGDKRAEPLDPAQVAEVLQRIRDGDQPAAQQHPSTLEHVRGLAARVDGLLRQIFQLCHRFSPWAPLPG